MLTYSIKAKMYYIDIYNLYINTATYLKQIDYKKKQSNYGHLLTRERIYFSHYALYVTNEDQINCFPHTNINLDLNA